jgi:hypothetical protein
MYAGGFAVNGAITLKNSVTLVRANSHGEQDNNIPVYKALQLSMQKEADRQHLLQTSNTRLTAESFVKRNDFAGAGRKANLRNQVIGEARRAVAGRLQSFPCNDRRLDGHASRLKQALQSVQNPFPLPSATKHPRQFSENEKWKEDATRRTSLREGGTSFSRLRRLVVEIGPRPYISIRSMHHHCLRAFASSISSKVMTPSAWPPSSAIFQRSSRS